MGTHSPGYCGSEYVDEGPECDFSGPGVGCTDNCCKQHDKCCGCGFDDCSRPCNQQLVDCLSSCTGSSDCEGDYGPVASTELSDFFSMLDSNTCCGMVCPGDYSMPGEYGYEYMAAYG